MFDLPGMKFFLVLLLMSASLTVQGAESPKHHVNGGFINPWDYTSNSFSDLLKWRWERGSKQIPGPDDYDFPVLKPNLDFLHNNRAANTATWIGHATLLMQLDGHNILTDPQFSRRASPVQWAGPQRVVPPAMTIEQLPPIDYVVISHDHYDSLDTDSIQALFKRPGGDQTVFVVPLKLKTWFENQGIQNVVELDWWESYSQDYITITAVPAQHWSKRSMFSRNKTLWAGWVIKTPGFNFYFCGDSGYYAPLFQEIGAKLGPFDLAAIPIGAYEPRWFMKKHHINPEESVQVHLDLRAEQSVAIHWGTFILTDEPLDEPPQRLQEALQTKGIPADTFRVLQHGESLNLPSNDWRISSH